MQRTNITLFGSPLNLTKKQIKQAVMEHLWESHIDLTSLDKCLAIINTNHHDILQEILMEQCDYDLHGQWENVSLLEIFAHLDKRDIFIAMRRYLSDENIKANAARMQQMRDNGLEEKCVGDYRAVTQKFEKMIEAYEYYIKNYHALTHDMKCKYGQEVFFPLYQTLSSDEWDAFTRSNFARDPHVPRNERITSDGCLRQLDHMDYCETISRYRLEQTKSYPAVLGEKISNPNTIEVSISTNYKNFDGMDIYIYKHPASRLLHINQAIYFKDMLAQYVLHLKAATNQRLDFLDSEISYLEKKTEESKRGTRRQNRHRPRCSVQ